MKLISFFNFCKLYYFIFHIENYIHLELIFVCGTRQRLIFFSHMLVIWFVPVIENIQLFILFYSSSFVIIQVYMFIRLLLSSWCFDAHDSLMFWFLCLFLCQYWPCWTVPEFYSPGKQGQLKKPPSLLILGNCSL